MSDPVTDTGPRCPWCSAALPSADLDRCPSCGAALASAGGSEPVLPGVTAIDPQAILRSRSEPPRQRNRLLSFLSGEVPVEDSEGSADSLAPPPADVRREMLKLEIEAEQSRLEAEHAANNAEAVSLAADAIASGKLVLPVDAQASVEAALGIPASPGPADAAASAPSTPYAPIEAAPSDTETPPAS
jgi:hypothetical protein